MRWLCLVALCCLAACKKTDGISRDLGASCQSHTDCNDRCLPEPRWPGGFCSIDCNDTDDCPVGSDCTTTSDGDVCLFLCFDDRDCDFLESGVGEDVWACRDVDGLRVCSP